MAMSVIVLAVVIVIAHAFMQAVNDCERKLPDEAHFESHPVHRTDRQDFSDP